MGESLWSGGPSSPRRGLSGVPFGLATILGRMRLSTAAAPVRSSRRLPVLAPANAAQRHERPTRRPGAARAPPRAPSPGSPEPRQPRHHGGLRAGKLSRASRACLLPPLPLLGGGGGGRGGSARHCRWWQEAARSRRGRSLHGAGPR